MATIELNLRTRLKRLADVLRSHWRDVEALGCVCASGTLAGFLVLTDLPASRFARDLLLFGLALLLARLGALIMESVR